MLEKTLVILKPCTLQRGLVGEITHRFERKGLRLAGMKMMQLTDELLSEHYAHLSGKPFFQRVKDSMMTTPVIVCCFEGVDAIQTVRTLAHQIVKMLQREAETGILLTNLKLRAQILKRQTLFRQLGGLAQQQDHSAGGGTGIQHKDLFFRVLRQFLCTFFLVLRENTGLF